MPISKREAAIQAMANFCSEVTALVTMTGEAQSSIEMMSDGILKVAMPDKDYPCPLCNTATDWRFECAGYPGTWNGKETIMVCVPPCDGAVEFYCKNRECDWWHRTPNHRSDATNMPDAPSWLDEALAAFKSNEDDRI